VRFVGIYDMLPHQTFPNGAHNVTEYGTPSDPDEFAAALQAAQAADRPILLVTREDARTRGTGSVRRSCSAWAMTRSR
jgi:hypothetical protein